MNNRFSLSFGSKKTLLSNSLLKGSALVLVSSTIVNLLNFFYTIIMGRMLGPSSYGVLTALVSLLYIVSVPSQTFQTVTSKFVSKYFAREDYFSIWNYFIKMIGYILLGSVLLLILLIPITPYLSSQLKIENSAFLWLVYVMAILSFLNNVGLGLLQGVQRFLSFSLVGIVAVLLKLVIGIVLVLFGYGVGGSLWGLIISSFVLLFLVWWLSKGYSRHKKIKPQTSIRKEVFTYSIYTSIAFVGLVLLVNQDVILVKYYFSSLEAGYYSALSMLGKIIFFASGAVAMVFFPLASENKEKGASSHSLLHFALLLVGFISLIGVVFYYFIPGFVVNLFYGVDYVSISPLLWLAGAFNLFYSFAYLLVLNFLASQKTWVCFVTTFFSLLQLGLIVMYHNNLEQVLYISIIVLVVLSITLYSLYSFNKEK